MYILITILILAFFALILMVGVKFFEFNTGKNLFPNNLHIKIEKGLVVFYKNLITLFVTIFKRLKNFLKNFPTLFTHFMHRQWLKLSKKIDQFFIKIRYRK
jgi:hypothetical protein